MLVLLFVALWFILRVDLLYVSQCVILFLCFSFLLVLRLPRLGKRELILVLLVRLFGLCLFRFVGFLFLLGSGKGCGLWLWHSLDFSLIFFIMVNVLKFRIIYFMLFLSSVFLFIQLFIKILNGMANSVDPDLTALGLHCLHLPFYKKFWCRKF